MLSLSKLIVKNLENNINYKIIGTKYNNNWKWFTKNDLYKNILICRDFLDNKNIKVGDRVAYKGDNSIEWISWNIATNSLGAVWVPMYGNQNKDYCRYIVNDCSPKLLITDDNELDIGINTYINTIPNYEASTNINFLHNDLSTLIYTSGTTGNPKGVMLSNKNIISNINTIRNRFGDIGPTTSLNILPWAHIYSQTCELYYNLLYDNKMALASSRENFIKECREVKPETLYLVPRVLELIKSKVEFLDKPLIKYLLPIMLNRLFGGNLLNIFTGGAKLDPSTRKFFSDNGIIICEGYGCSETSPMVSVNHLSSPRNIDSIGKILDDILVEIVDGEIQVSGPNVMMGYWKNENATKDVLVERDGKIWYKTGDSGELKNNFLFYNGRISENYKLSNGKFVNVPEVEEKIKKYINGTFIIFGEGDEYNSLITEDIIDDQKLKNLNTELDSYLRINKIYNVTNDELNNFLTPKMSIKRKLLIDYVKNKLK